MNFVSLLEPLRRSWWVIVAALVVTVGSTAFFNYQQIPVYRATSTILLGPHEGLAGAEEVRRSLASLDRTVVSTYARIPSSQLIRDKARRRMNLSSAEMDQYTNRTSVMPDTTILRVSVDGPDPVVAADAANAIALEARNYIRENYHIFSATVLDPASPPADPSRPNVQRNLRIGMIGGLLLGITIVLLLEYLRQLRKVRGAQRVTTRKTP